MDHILSDLSTVTRPSWVTHRAWLSFIELDQAVVCVIRLASSLISVCLPSDDLLQHLLSYLGFSYLGRGVSLHGCSSKVQSLLLTLDEGYLLTAAPPDLECGVAPLSPPAPAQPQLLSCPTLCNPMDGSLPVCSVLGDSPGKNTRMGCHSFCQKIFATKGLVANPCNPPLQVDSLPTEPPGKPVCVCVCVCVYKIEYYSDIKRMKFCHLQQCGQT